jgi:pimeloyl-ACP methyl ester carboxylesterase
LVLLDGAGHFAFMTSPDSFLAVLLRKIRPIAISRGAF